MRLILSILAIFVFWTSQLAHAGSYRFQPGDTVQISVWQEPKLDRQVVVAPDGSIAIPLVGRVAAGRRSAGQIEASIKGRLSETYQGDIDVTVSFVSRSDRVERQDEKIDPTIFRDGRGQ